MERRPGFAFNHLLTQQAAYDALLGSNRRALHSAVADALEAQLRPGSPEELPLLARLIAHLEAAGRWLEAHQHCCTLLYRRAGMGRVQGLAELADHAQALWDRAGLGHPDWPASSASLANSRATLLAHTSRLAEASDFAEQALEFARGEGDALQAAQAFNNLGIVAHYSGLHAAAIQHYRQALDAFRAIPDEHGMLQIYNNLGLALFEADQAAEASAILLEGLALAQPTAHQQLIAMLSLNAGLALMELGELDTAATRFRQTIDVARRIGFLTDEGIALGYLGELEARQGRPGTARDYYSSALHLAQASGSERFTAWWQAHLGELELAAGELARARAQLDAGLANAGASGSMTIEGYILCLLAQLDLAADQPAAAVERWARTLEVMARLGSGRRWRLSDKVEQVRSELTLAGLLDSNVPAAL